MTENEKQYLVSEKQIEKAVNYWIAHGDMDADKLISGLSKKPVQKLDRKMVETIFGAMNIALQVAGEKHRGTIYETAITDILSLVPEQPKIDRDRVRNIIFDNVYQYYGQQNQILGFTSKEIHKIINAICKGEKDETTWS